MIIKLHIWFENKIVLNKFKLNICNNAITIETLSFSSKEKDKITLGEKQSFPPNETTRSKNEFLPQNVKHSDETTDTKNSIIKIIVYNKYNGIDYIPLCFPLKMYIIDNLVFNPYIILSSYNLTSDNRNKNYTSYNNILERLK
jgi:hypothetical protein